MPPCRLIFDGPQDGEWNMAVDEALLEDAAERGAATLRFYQWRQPTISLGYFQRHAERQSHAASGEAAIVRRLSGGGALVHDRELTYALCLPADHPSVGDSSTLYATVHRAIIAALKSWGLAAMLQREAPSDRAPTVSADEPFLCFARRTAADVVLPTAGLGQARDASAKIVGSAQRRRGGAVLQHGAILLAASPAAPELPGIQDVTSVSIAPDELAQKCSENLAVALAVAMSRGQVDEPVLSAARRLYGEKYTQACWTERR